MLMGISSCQGFFNLANIEKLIGDNFVVWKFQMNIMVGARKLLGIVDEFVPKASYDNVEEWKDKDATCEYILILAIDPKLLCSLMNY